MNRRLLLTLTTLVVLVVGGTGCTGDNGGSGGGGTSNTVGGSDNVTGEALLPSTTLNPEDLTEKVDITLEHGNIQMIVFNITITDVAGSENPDTPEDDVKQVIFSEKGEEANYNVTLSGGTTTFERQVVVDWDEENLIGGAWEITMMVTCNPDEDQWIGPLIYRGYQDYGFSYRIEVSYQYQDK